MVDGVENISPSTTASSSVASSVTASTNYTSVSASVVSTPDKLTDLSHQIQIAAVALSISISGKLLLTTALGEFTLVLSQLTDSQRKLVEQQISTLIGSQRALTLIVQPGTPPQQAVLLLPTANAASLSLSNQTPIIPALPSGTSISPISIGTTLTAIVLPELPHLPEAAPLTSALSKGDLSIIAQQEKASQAAIPIVMTSSLSQEINLQPGTNVVLQVADIKLPSAAQGFALAPLTSSSPQQIIATVSGTAPGGQTILITDNQSLFVKQTINAPIGTQLLLSVSLEKEPNLAIIPSLQSNNYTELPEALAALSQINSQLASQVINTRIPMPDNSLSGALLYIMGAFNKQNSLNQWLGDDAVNALSGAGKYELITKLTKSLESSVGNVQDTTVGEWKSYSIPLYANNHFQPLNIYVHQDQQHPFRKASSTDQGAGYMRFLIDMRMSQLGPMQFDGFVQPKKLDIIVRSEINLPQDLLQDLRRTYINMLGGIDYSGAINFQVGRQHWIHVQQNSSKTTVTM